MDDGLAYRVVFSNAISTHGMERHDRSTYEAAMELANDRRAWPFNNTRVNVMHMDGDRVVRDEQISPDPEVERRERERMAATYRRR